MGAPAWFVTFGGISVLGSLKRLNSRSQPAGSENRGAVAARSLALLIVLAVGAVEAAPIRSQSAPVAGCVDWRACRELALAAAERGEYETFHDLAWRAVQTGPPKDPALMYLLARAQALSGR